MHSRELELQHGDLFAKRYRIGDQLGRGASATVYEAVNTENSSLVALKVVTNPSYPSNKVTQEATVQSQLHHPHILTLHGHGDANGTIYLDLELANGDFEEEIRKQHNIPIERAIPVILDTVLALSHAHKEGFLHLDPKPSSLLYIDRDFVKVGDWGHGVPIELAKPIDPDDTYAFSEAYCAPEQRFGGRPLTTQTDIYILGLTAHSMLTGAIRHSRSPSPRFFNQGLWLRNQMNPIYEEVEGPIRKAFSREPSDRHASMADFHHELKDAFETGITRNKKQKIIIDTGKRGKKK